MKRAIKLSDGVIFIFVCSIGMGITAYYSERFTADDVFMSLYFMLFSFISIFLLLGKKIRGGE